jgi:hypothetical protein
MTIEDAIVDLLCHRSPPPYKSHVRGFELIHDFLIFLNV